MSVQLPLDRTTYQNDMDVLLLRTVALQNVLDARRQLEQQKLQQQQHGGQGVGMRGTRNIYPSVQTNFTSTNNNNKNDNKSYSNAEDYLQALLERCQITDTALRQPFSNNNNNMNGGMYKRIHTTVNDHHDTVHVAARPFRTSHPHAITLYPKQKGKKSPATPVATTDQEEETAETKTKTTPKQKPNPPAEKEKRMLQAAPLPLYMSTEDSLHTQLQQQKRRNNKNNKVTQDERFLDLYKITEQDRLLRLQEVQHTQVHPREYNKKLLQLQHVAPDMWYRSLPTYMADDAVSKLDAKHYMNPSMLLSLDLFYKHSTVGGEVHDTGVVFR